ncbi:hypothetical protein G4B88_004567, partial [Cannabis sativa]
MAITTLSHVSFASNHSLINDRSLGLKRSFFIKGFSSAPLSLAFKTNFGQALENVSSKRLLTTPHHRSRHVVCAIPQDNKVPVAPLELENSTRPPTNLYSENSLHTATILSVDKISGPKAPAETYRIVYFHDGFLPYWEGQVLRVMKAPDENPFEPGNPENLSFFSAASSRYGDSFNGKTTTLCVRSIPGTTSEILCKSKRGDKIQLAGPTREAMISGDFRNPNATHIFVATGTGVAPFRAHLRRFFKEDIPTFQFSGLAWLFHGVSNNDSALFKDEFEQYQKEYPNNFRYNIAYSREQKNKLGGKMYVQDIFSDYADEVLELLLKGAYIYLAGLKDMVKPIEDALSDAATKKDKDWNEILTSLKINDQWRVEAKLKTCFFFKVGVLFILLQTSYVSSKASSLPFNILETNYYINGLRNPTRVVNTPRKVVGGEKFPVAPLSLEHALRPPTNLYTSSAPHTATILSVKKITGENASTETYHIPENPFTVGNSSQLRYFTSASSRYGDMFNGRTASLCVSLSIGSTSEVLIKSKPGDKIQLTGPSGEAMLLGNFNPKATHIFVATGTGIAPFRAHLRQIPTYKFSGFAWLFHGVSNADSVLYEDEFDQYLKDYPENFRYDIALTSDEKYVQDIVVEYASEVLELLLKGAYIYLSGNKKMVTPIESGLNITANNNGKNWDEILETLKSNNQWRVE